MCDNALDAYFVRYAYVNKSNSLMLTSLSLLSHSVRSYSH